MFFSAVFSSVTSTVTVAVVSAAIITAAYGLYNIYLHPLRRYPGPKLWAAYRIPYVINYMNGVLPYRVLELHRQNGPVVRIAPDELAFTDAEAWHDIYGRHADHRQNPIDVMTFTPEEPGMEESFAGATDAMHTRLRRIYAPAFAPRAIDELSATVLKYSDLLVSRLQESIVESSIQNIHDWYNFSSFDIMGAFAFGESFHCLETAKSHMFMRTILPGIKAAVKMNQLERYGIYSALKPLIPKSAMQAKVDIDNYVSELLDRRQSRSKETEADVFTYLEQSELSRQALEQNSIIIVMAGSQSVATILTAATWFLCKHPTKLKRVKKEVRQFFHSDDQITAKSSRSLQYLNAVISETLRLIPGGAFGNPRWIRSKGGQMVAEYHVPDNTRCSLYHYAVYRHEKNFTRPDEFVPERWLPEADKEFSGDDHRAFQPFNVGPRSCIGEKFANMELGTVLPKMLWHFNFELADPNDTWDQKLGAYPIWDKPPLMVRLTAARR